MNPEETRLAEETEAAIGEMLSALAMWTGAATDMDALAALCEDHGEDPKALEARLRKLLGWHP